jgi:hypothetical protein
MVFHAPPVAGTENRLDAGACLRYNGTRSDGRDGDDGAVSDAVILDAVLKRLSGCRLIVGDAPSIDAGRSGRILEKSPLKRICDIEADQPPYGIAVLSRFRSKVGPERLSRVMDQTVDMLVRKGRIKGETLALDSTFIKAHSRRNLDNRTGYSDPESRGWGGLSRLRLGYRLHSG